MAKPASVNPTQVVRVFESLSGKIKPYIDPNLGKYLIQLVKSNDEFSRFKANASATLTANKLDPKLVNAAAVTALAQSVIDRIAGLGKGPAVMDTVSNTQSSSNQESNFDHSSSWFTNYDGWNVAHEAGHSSEQSSGSAVGQDKNFSGFTTQPGEVFQGELTAVFYPGQPLVSPLLVSMIKAATREVGE